MTAGRGRGFWLNGRWVELDCPDHELLLDVLRERLGLTGAKRSCDVQVCGACTVLVDDRPVSSCCTLWREAEGRSVVTIEGVAAGDQLDPVQAAFARHGALQCGFCTPGMVLAVKALLNDHARPSRQQVVEGLEGNLCRCTGYQQIVAAVMDFASQPEGEGL